MSKRTYILIAVLLFFLAGYFAEAVLDAMECFVVPNHIAPIQLLSATPGRFLYFRFFLPFGLACAAIPIAFMIIKNHRRTVLVVTLSLVGSGIVLLGLQYRLRAGMAFCEHHGIKAFSIKDHLDLEIVPWVSFAITVLGTVVLKLEDKKGSQHAFSAV